MNSAADQEQALFRKQFKRNANLAGRRIYIVAGLIMVFGVVYFMQADYEYNFNFVFYFNREINETNIITNQSVMNFSSVIITSSTATTPTTSLLRRTNTKRQLADIGTLRWYRVPEHVTKSDKWFLSVLSAYYDHRIKKVVVLLASEAASLSGPSHSFPYTFLCQLFYGNETVPVETEAYYYTSYLLYCPLPKSYALPSTFSLKRNDSINEENSWTIPVVNLLDRKAKIKPKKLAICVGIMFGYQNWLILLQYIEFHRMQGVEKLIFFYSDLHWSAVEIFQWYKHHTNFIELVKWTPNHFACDNEYSCQLLRDNFCSYSLMYKYKFVGNSDFDELFFPVSGTLVDLLDKFDRSDRGSFTFRAKYHQLLKNDIPEWDDVTYENVSSVVKVNIPLYHYRNVSTVADHFYSPKTITKPETVLKRWIHYVERHVKGTGIYHFAKNEAVLRHFKIRQWWGNWADEADGVVKFKIVNPAEEVGEKLLHDMTKRVTKIIKLIKLF